MRRFGVLLSVVVVMLLGTLALHAQPVAIAQEATPAGEEMMPEGVTFEPVTFAMGVEVPSPSDLAVFRISSDRGGGEPFAAPAPGGGFLLGEPGTSPVRGGGRETVT